MLEISSSLEELLRTKFTFRTKKFKNSSRLKVIFTYVKGEFIKYVLKEQETFSNISLKSESNSSLRLTSRKTSSFNQNLKSKILSILISPFLKWKQCSAKFLNLWNMEKTKKLISPIIKALLILKLCGLQSFSWLSYSWLGSGKWLT